jgi:hypothetical protein
MGGAKPAVWKQNMVVLLVLYPVVFLLGRYFQSPLLMGWGGLPFWASLFIGNVTSVVMMNWLVPWTGQGLGWWLKPQRRTARLDWSGAAVVMVLYGLSLLVFFLNRDCVSGRPDTFLTATPLQRRSSSSPAKTMKSARRRWSRRPDGSTRSEAIAI